MGLGADFHNFFPILSTSNFQLFMTATTSVQASVNISPQEFRQLANPPLLIDVRSQLEYLTGHTPKAMNLSLPRLLIGRVHWLQKWVLPQWFRDLPKDKPIAVICLTAHRSPIAADVLLKAGFRKIFNVTGGIKEWRRLGLPIEK